MPQFDHNKYQPIPPFKYQDRTWPSRELSDAPIWCSVDLRDGNQALIEPMSVEQKLEMWDALIALGFKEIEIGFPSASQTEYNFTRRLIDENRIPDDVTVQVLVQAREHLIEKTFDSLIGIKKAIVHVYNSTSKIQREKVFKLEREGIVDIAVNGANWLVEYAAKYPDTQWQFQYSPESFTGTEIDFAVEVCNQVIDIWQPTADKPCVINLPATVETHSPNVFADQIEYMSGQLNRREGVLLSVHTHNDRGCAVAASELALLAGADRVEGTILGNGERTGNMDIITLAMNLYSQGIEPKLNLADIEQHLEVFERCTQLPRHPRHPWVGELVYTAFSGSHQDAIKKCLAQQEQGAPWEIAYLPIDPADLGRDYEAVIRVNSQSGKGGIAYLLEQEFGYKLPRWLQIKFSSLVQAYSDAKGEELSPAMLSQLLWQNYGNTGSINIEKYAISKEGQKSLMNIELNIADQLLNIEADGNGALDAFCHAIAKTTGNLIHIRQYHEHALQKDSDAEAICYIEAEIGGHSSVGIGRSTDVIGAGFEAVIAAVEHSLAANPQKLTV